MYNPMLKERFIADYSDKESMQAMARGFFELFEEYETKWAADLCTRSAEEIEPIVNKMIGMRRGSKYSRMNVLSMYLKWCVEHQVPGAKDTRGEIVVSRDDNMRRGTVANPAHLQWYLNQLLRPESEDTIDNVLRCYYWLAYGGATEDEALGVKISDVNFTTMTVKCSGYKEIPIYREALPAFRSCTELTQFRVVLPHYKKDSFRDRAPGDLLLRGIKPEINHSAFRVPMSNKTKAAVEAGKTDLRLSYFRVFISGVFYRTYELERAGMPIDFKKIASSQLQVIDRSKLTKPQNAKTRRTLKAREFQYDYECWKRVYA